LELGSAFPWRTERVELFLLEPEFVTERYVSWLCDPEVNRYLESRFLKHDMVSTVAFVSKMREDPDVLMLGIRSLALGAHVGNIKLGPLDHNHGIGDIGLMIGERSAWGRGLATDAIVTMIRIASKQLRLRKLTAGCYASNVGSELAFRKAGFHVEARRKNHFLLEGRVEDLVLMARHLDNDHPPEGRA
jgi:RimJ/RimL family protein N-acetyltransferase